MNNLVSPHSGTAFRSTLVPPYVGGPEYQLFMSFRTRKRFVLSDYFDGGRYAARLNMIHVKQRAPVQRENGKKMELDVVGESDCGRVVVVEVKKMKTAISRSVVADFAEKVRIYAESNPDRQVLPAILSLGGFTKGARQLCEDCGIATAERIVHF